MSNEALIKQMTCKQAEVVRTLVDYYDGDQVKHLITLLDAPGSRTQWRERGLIPRTRNLTKMIVDKSGMLFNDKAPLLEVQVNGSTDERQSKLLMQQLEQMDWIEFYTNVDPVVRMSKTALVLLQWEPDEGELCPAVLTRANAAVQIDPLSGDVLKLVYKTTMEGEEENKYRVFTNEVVYDIVIDDQGQEVPDGPVIPNPYGGIPIAEVHDTNVPRTGFWNKVDPGLLQINDMYNLHITDSEFAGSWAKFSTLFTNASLVQEADSAGRMEAVEEFGKKIPTLIPRRGALIGGPSKVIELDTGGVGTPFVEYKNPQVDLMPIHEIFDKMVSDYAADWSVRVEAGGSGTADSGFKLIVQEIPNLELRKKRQRMFEAHFKDLFKVIRMITNTFIPGTYTDDAVCVATFSAPQLPVDEQQDEMIWTMRITEGRASLVDYFMEKKGMSRQQAEEKIAQIQADKALVPAVAKPVVTTKVAV